MAFDWVRELNEGVGKIYEEMKKAGLPNPEYQIRGDGYYVKLVLRNNLEKRILRFGMKPRMGLMPKLPLKAITSSMVFRFQSTCEINVAVEKRDCSRAYS